MSQAEDFLNSLTADEEIEEHIVIGKDRFITVPPSLRKIAVQYDNNVRTVTFDCPRYSDGRDLSTMIITINYMRPDNESGLYEVGSVTIDETDDTIMHFDWVIEDDVTRVNGALSFLVCAKKTNSDGTNENHWNSELNQEMTISKGLNCSESIIQKYPDLIAQILTRLDTIENNSGSGSSSGSGLDASGAEIDQVPTADGNGNWSWKEQKGGSGSSGVSDYDQLNNKPITRITGTSDSPIFLRSLSSGQYQLYGLYQPYEGSNTDMSTDTPVIVNINTDTDISHVQIFFANENQIQYLTITDSTYTSKYISINQLVSDNELSVKRREIVVSDANEYTTIGYAKTEYGVTQNLPEQVYGGSTAYSSEWGILFFVAENASRKTGTQMFHPVDGPYEGRVFVRSLTNTISDSPEIGSWSLLANEAEVNTAKYEANAYTDQNMIALLQYVQTVIKPYDITWTNGYYISRTDGSVNAEEGSSYCDFVSVEPGTRLIISNTMTADTEYNVFYDSEQNFLSSFSTDNGSVVTVPDGARFFRLSKHTTDTVVVMPEVFIKKPKATTISLPTDGWTGSNLLYQQTVSVPIVKENSQVELRPSPAQLQELLTSEISLTAANESGSVTVFAIGGKPISDYAMQIIVSEVDIV